VSEIPTRVTLSIHMATAGLVVAGGLWERGGMLTRTAAAAFCAVNMHPGRHGAAGTGCWIPYEPAASGWGEWPGAAAAAAAGCVNGLDSADEALSAWSLRSGGALKCCESVDFGMDFSLTFRKLTYKSLQAKSP